MSTAISYIKTQQFHDSATFHDNFQQTHPVHADWNSLPLSIASISASVSLLRMQSMSCRWERSPALSSRRSPAMWPEGPPTGIAPDLGRALRPSNSSTSNRSTSRVVSSTHLHNQHYPIQSIQSSVYILNVTSGKKHSCSECAFKQKCLQLAFERVVVR